MKTTGITRKIDHLGRIVIPVEIRRSFDIEEGDEVELYVEEDRIILQKPYSTCVFCESSDNLVVFKEEMICRDCVTSLFAEGDSEPA